MKSVERLFLIPERQHSNRHIAEEIKEITPTAEKIFTKPVIIGIAAFVILQIAIAGILIFMHSKGKAEEERRRRRFADAYEEADETIKK